MRALLSLVMMVLVLLTAAPSAQAVPPLPAPKLYAVYFWASWCPNCKLLTPIVAEARAKGGFDTKDVLFVTMDLSDSATIHQSVMLARALGIDGFVQPQGSATGYVALLAADKHTELARFDRTAKAAEMQEEIDKQLGAATPSAPPATKP